MRQRRTRYKPGYHGTDAADINEIHVARQTSMHRNRAPFRASLAGWSHNNWKPGSYKSGTTQSRRNREAPIQTSGDVPDSDRSDHDEPGVDDCDGGGSDSADEDMDNYKPTIVILIGPSLLSYESREAALTG